MRKIIEDPTGSWVFVRLKYFALISKGSHKFYPSNLSIERIFPTQKMYYYFPVWFISLWTSWNFNFNRIGKRKFRAWMSFNDCCILLHNSIFSGLHFVAKYEVVIKNSRPRTLQQKWDSTRPTQSKGSSGSALNPFYILLWLFFDPVRQNGCLQKNKILFMLRQKCFLSLCLAGLFHFEPFLWVKL